MRWPDRKFFYTSWRVKMLCVTGRYRQAVLFHHAEKSGKEAGYYMDTYIQDRHGMRSVNMYSVKHAYQSLSTHERVSRLMYRVGLLSYEGFCRILEANERNRRELMAHVTPEALDYFSTHSYSDR